MATTTFVYPVTRPRPLRLPLAFAISAVLLAGCDDVFDPGGKDAAASLAVATAAAAASPSRIGPPVTPPPSQAGLVQIAEASLAANIRMDHPHGRDTGNNPGAPPTTSPSVRPGNAFTQGTPGDDIEQTALYSIGSITGETGGFDIFNAVNPADPRPGNGLVTAFYAGTNARGVDAPGDRYLLGDHNRAYYLGRTGDIDNDFARIMQIDTRDGNEIVLHGGPEDYAFVQTTGPDAGTAIFYNDNGLWDMIGYIDIEVRLSPVDPIYRYVDSTDRPTVSPTVQGRMDQFGGAGADLITAMAVDGAGNLYVTGVSRSDLTGQFPSMQGEGDMFVAKYSASGQRLWLTQFGSPDRIADLSWDIAVDGNALFIAARYVPPQNQQNSFKDAAYFRLDAATGAVSHEEIWGGFQVQFAGNVALDNGEFVYFSGIGFDTAAPNPDGSQDPYIEKRRRSDLSLVRRKMFGGDADNVPGAGGAFNKEPWGGLSFVPTAGGAPGEGRLYSAGWTQGSYEGTEARGGGDVWLVAFDQNLNELWAEGWGSNQRDWAWDLDVDANGFVYVVGLTLGAMAGPGSRIGQSDGFVTKLDPNAPPGSRVLWTRQIGTARNDELRKINIVDNHLYVAGHTYGDIAAANAGQSDLWVSKLDLDGTVLQSFQIGTRQDERAVLAAHAGGVYIGGYTFGALLGQNRGFLDAFATKLDLNLQFAWAAPPATDPWERPRKR